MTNPKLVVEVQSPGTEDYDRKEKVEHYKRIPSLITILLVDELVELVELWNRDEMIGHSSVSAAASKSR